MQDVDIETLGEHLYQVSLGKAPPKHVDDIVAVASKLWPGLPFDQAAAYALALAELRQDLATAEDNKHAHAATGLKRKIDLFEDLFLQALERTRA